MEDLRYIFAKPILIEGVGFLSAITVNEYIEYGTLFNVLSITTKTLLRTVDSKDKEQRGKIEKKIKAFDLICADEQLLTILLRLLIISFKTKNVNFVLKNREILVQYKGDKDIVEFSGKINRDNYDFVRNNIIKVNNVHLPKQAKTKELQEWFDKETKLKNKNNRNTFEDTITSIMAFAHYTPCQLEQFTIYQINKLIERILKITEYESNIQFLCVGAKNIKLESWCSNIPEEEEKTQTLDEFEKSFVF